MRWTTKARMQRWCAALPGGGAGLYYALQRLGGGLRDAPHPEPWLRAAYEIAADMIDSGVPLEGARLMEVGTGRGVEMPAGFHLMGAGPIHTFDLHRLLVVWRIEGLMKHLAADPDGAGQMLGPYAADGPAGVKARIARLVAGAPSADEALKRMQIHYHAPADAARTGLPDGCIDAHVSFTVFEHIPGAVLTDILREAGRVLAKEGVAVHHVDMTDHFSHQDPAIPPIHFLRYSQQEWDRLAGNDFAYQNRLRIDEVHRIFGDAGHEIVRRTDWTDERGLAELRQQFPLAAQFAGRPVEILAASGTRVVSRPRSA